MCSLATMSQTNRQTTDDHNAVYWSST